MNDTIRDRLELLLAKIAGNEVSIRTMTPGVVTNLTEKFLIDIANRIDDIEQASGVKPSLSKLTDVDLSSPSDGQALIYDAENDKWINKTIDSTYSLKDMSDVDISSLSDEQALVYNSTTNKWENSNKIKNIDSQIGSINSSLVWLNNHMSESDGRITSLEGRATDLETQEAALSNRLTQAESDISDIDSIAKSAISNEASKFDTSEGTQYSVGDYCIYENKLYICKRNTSSPVFDITAWEEVNIGDELKKNRNDISSVASDVQSALDTASAASTTAASASTDASTALSAAASALSSATSAVSTANSAATDATTALATAAIASSDASTAVNTANTANTRSQNALKAIAPTYNTSLTYNAGDYCTNNGALYKCNTDNTTGQWDATRWTKVNVGDELKLTSNVQSDWNETDTASDAYIQNKPTIPANTSDLTNDSNFVSDASYVHTDNNFTNTIKDKIDSIASGAEVNVQSNWNETDTTSDSYIRNKPSIPTVNDATLTVQKNGTDVGTFTANASSDSTINITVPTTAADVSALPSSTKYGSSITVSIDQTDYKITTTLKDQDGNTLGTAQVIDLPIESVVVSGSFDSVNKKIVLTLQNGSTIDIPVGDLVSGLQSEITSENKLLSDLIDDTNQTNKFMTSAEKTKLSGIASGAEVNVQSDWNESVTTSDAYIKNKPSIPSNTSDLTNDSNFVSDASYVHTDNNFTSALKSKLDGIATGAEVNVQSDWNESVTTSDAYIKNKPSIPTKTSDLTNDSDYVSDASYVHTDNNFTTAIKNKVDGIESGAEANVQSDWNEADSTSDAYIQNKPTIPTVNNGKLTIQMNGSTVREFTANQSSNVTANITVPTKTSDIINDSDFVSDASYVHTDNNFTTTLKNKLDGIASGAEVNVQADWNQSSSSSDAFIKNKPTIPSKTSDLTNDSDFVEDASYVHTDNNFTSVLKNKLDGIAEGAEVNVQSDWNVTDNSSSAYIKNKPSIPTKTSDLTNDSGFVEDASYVHTDNNFTTSLKNKLNGIETGAEVNVQSDWSQTTTTADDYIKNKPTIPTKTSDLTNDSNFVEDASYVHTDNNFTSTLKNKLDGIASGAEVNVQADWDVTDNTSDAFIKNKPNIPTVNNAVLTIQKNGTTVNTFTANASSDVTANIVVPTKTSDLTNDSGFITDISGKVSKSGDTMTGELQLDDTNARIKNATVAHAFSIEPSSGGAVQLHYAASGNHGIYSKGYGSSLTDSSTFNDDTAWIIYRNATGYVLVPKWANTGNFLTPISFNEYGSPSVSKGQTIPYIVGTGTTAGTWTGTLTGLTAYYDGLLILYKTPVAGATTTTLNLNSLGAKTIYTSGTTKLTTHFPINQPMLLVYSTDTDDGCWKAVDFYNSDTRPQAQCNTAAATAAKAADMTYFTATDKSYLMVNMRYANTSASKITLNVNSTGAKDIYINGAVSSATNYTLPAGSYLVYYSDSKYYFRTDGKITGDITGNAATVGGCTVATNVPSGAVFTDSKVTITNDTSTNGSFRVLLGTTRDNNTVTEGVKKSTSLLFNPSTGVFYTPREVINATGTDIPLIIRTDNRSSTPENGDDIVIFNGAFKKTVSGTSSTLYNSVISLIGNNASTSVGVVRFGSSNGATIITGGAGAKAFPKNFVNADSSTGKYNSDGAIWLAAQSEVHIYTNASNSAAKFGGHIWMNQGGLRVDRTDASAGTLNNMYLVIGNNTAKSNAGAAKGTIQIWDRNSSGTAYSAKISPDTLTQERTITIPDKSGVIQLQPTWSLLDEVTFDGTTDRYSNATLPSGVKGLFVRIYCSPASEHSVFVDGLFNDMTSYMRISEIEFDSSNNKVIAYSYAYTIGNGLWKFESTDATTMSMISDFVMGNDVGLHTRVFAEDVSGRLISSDTKLRAIQIWFHGGGNFPSGSKLSIYIMQ